MKNNLYILLTLGHYVWPTTAVSKYFIHHSCKTLKLNDGNTIDVVPRLRDGMHEAIDLVENARKVLSEHSGDNNVKNILRLLLREDPGRVQSAKTTLDRLSQYERDPQPLVDNDETWVRNQQANTDVEFYCGGSEGRYIKDKSREFGMIDTLKENTRYTTVAWEKHKKLFDLKYDPSNEAGASARALTTDSGQFNRALWIKDGNTDSNRGGRGPEDPRYTNPRPHLANHIEVATWYLHWMNNEDWPHLDKSRVGICSRDEFIQQFLANSVIPGRRRPVDAVQSFGMTLLHEGGSLKDLPDLNSCYGWGCIQVEQNPRNSDTITWLVAGLKLWEMGYTVDAAGIVTEIT